MRAFDVISSFGASVGGYLALAEVPQSGARRYGLPENAAVVPFSLPYYRDGETNLANFAAAPDYHVYAALINGALTEYFAGKYPERYCRVFADVSPFGETVLAASCGLGVIGDHGLLIDPEYSSFIVLGEAVVELTADELAAEGFSPADGIVRYCEHCGACRRACPTGGVDEKSRCLSAVTQKKGELGEDEIALLRENRAVWGCDRCVRACPHTGKKPKQTDIPYFIENRLGIVTEADISRMTDEEYKRYSFSWRKRDVMIRNLRICGFFDNFDN